MIAIGIDPGYKGFVSILDEQGKLLDNMPMPVMNVKKGYGRKCIDGWALMNQFATWLDRYSGDDHEKEVIVFLEEIRTFGFGKVKKVSWPMVHGCGVVIWAATQAGNIPVHEVAVNSWHKYAYDTTKGITKEMAIDWCRSRGYDMDRMITGIRKKRINDNAAESVIIARYGQVVLATKNSSND